MSFTPTVAPSAIDLPTEIKRLSRPTEPAGSTVGYGLEITFSSGRKLSLASRTLREGCPCASCLEARGDRTHQQPLSAGRSLLRVIRSSSEQQLDLQSVWAVGNYAIGLRWGDGHDTGIFTYQQLSELAAAAAEPT